MTKRLAICAGLVLGLACTELAGAASPAIAPPPDLRGSRFTPASDRYDACLAKAQTKSETAYEDAMSWKAEGGEGPAEHCAALALIGMQKYADAAERLDRLAENPLSGEAQMRGQILAQAGNAWLLSGRPAQALQSFNASLGLAPGDPETLLDRARASALLEKWASSERDLSAALAIKPSNPQALVLRASARRAQGNWPGAEGDVTKAILLDSNSLDALVELGLIRMAKGDKSGAREAFLAVLAKDAKSAAADSAREGIAKLAAQPVRAPRVLPAKPAASKAPTPPAPQDPPPLRR